MRETPQEGRVELTHVYLDGSLSTSDWRTRRAGWGVCSLTQQDSKAELQHGWFGDVDGNQTAATGELAALWWALQLTEGDATFYTDCSMVMKGWARRNQEQPVRRNEGWWRRIELAEKAKRGQCYTDEVLLPFGCKRNRRKQTAFAGLPGQRAS